ncbi:hypothetical protein, partial [Vibrio atlanticus]
TKVYFLLDLLLFDDGSGQELLSATTLKRFRPKLCYRVVYCVLLVTHNAIHELKRQGYVK